jgi:ABC-2 type transport system ATP-binding protein
LFLDEPTTGLDPQSRRQLWELIAGFKTRGRTVILTTHYMEEAERLCDRVAVVDHGKVIALGAPRELIASLGADQVIELSFPEGVNATEVCRAVAGVLDLHQKAKTLTLRVAQLHRSLPALLESLRVNQIQVEELRTHVPTLEDVFVALTGRHLRDG